MSGLEQTTSPLGPTYRPLRLEDGFLLWPWLAQDVHRSTSLRACTHMLVSKETVVAEHRGRFLGYIVAERVGIELRLVCEDVRWSQPYSKSYLTYGMVRWLLGRPAHRGVLRFRFGEGFANSIGSSLGAVHRPRP